MKKQWAEWVCDSCGYSRKVEPYTTPDTWVEVRVSMKLGTSEEVVFCGECWQSGQKPKNQLGLPVMIQKLLGFDPKSARQESDASGAT